MTEHTIPASAEGLPKIGTLPHAFETSLVLCSLLNVCRAAAIFIEEDDGHFARGVPANLAKVLEHTEKLAEDVLVALERATKGGAA